MIELGQTGIDIVTGFRGVCCGRAEYISGCEQVLLIPPIDKDGKRQDGEWIDDQRVKAIEEVQRICLNNDRTPGPDIAPTRRH